MKQHIQNIKIIISFACACNIFFTSDAQAEQICFIASEDNHIIHAQGACNKRMSPCSTFKIAISLMGFDSGILTDESHPTLNYQPCHVDWLNSWKQPHNPGLWMKNSCVWYSQEITKKLGIQRLSDYVKLFNYGNHDVSGDKNMNNGLTHCWLSSSLTISPQEQIIFLNKLTTNTLPVSIDAQLKTKKIMYQETLPNGWDLYGKTGNGSLQDAQGNKIKNRQVGWFVGFVCKNKKIITFTYLITDEDTQSTYASLRAKASLKELILKIINNK